MTLLKVWNMKWMAKVGTEAEAKGPLRIKRMLKMRRLKMCEGEKDVYGEKTLHMFFVHPMTEGSFRSG